MSTLASRPFIIIMILMSSLHGAYGNTYDISRDDDDVIISVTVSCSPGFVINPDFIEDPNEVINTPCLTCAKGTYQPVTNPEDWVLCQPCPAGKTTNQTASTSPLDCLWTCPSGEEYIEMLGCTACQPNYYKDNDVLWGTQFEPCTPCSIDQFTEGEGATTATSCTLGCPPGSARYGDRCYTILPLSVLSAKTACEEEELQAAKLSQPATSHVAASLAIGVRSNLLFGLDGVDGEDGFFAWTDGQSLSWTNWAVTPTVNTAGVALTQEAFWEATNANYPALCMSPAPEMACVPKWIHIANHYSSGSNRKPIAGTTTPTECIHACQMETEFTCTIVQYSKILGTCNLEDHDPEIVSFNAHPYYDIYILICENVNDTAELESEADAIYSASSHKTDAHLAEYGRAYTAYDGSNSDGHTWRPAASDIRSWLQVDYNCVVKVTMIFTQGSGLDGAVAWTTSFILLYQKFWPSDLWYYYTDQIGEPKTFLANDRREYAQMHRLFRPIITRGLRITVSSPTAPALRFGALGRVMLDYELEQRPNPLGMEDGHINDYQLTTDPDLYYTSSSKWAPPWNARPFHIYNYVDQYFVYRPPDYDQSHWIQVDLMVMHYVSGLAHMAYLWDSVTFCTSKTYAISYSSTPDDASFTYLLNKDGTERVFWGSRHEDILIYEGLNITARYVRLHPRTFITYPAIRFEIYGYPIESVELDSESMVISSPSGCGCTPAASATNLITWCSAPSATYTSQEPDPSTVIELTYTHMLTAISLRTDTNFEQLIAIYLSGEDMKWVTINATQMWRVEEDGASGYEVTWTFGRVNIARFVSLHLLSTSHVCGGVKLHGVMLQEECPPGFLHHLGQCFWAVYHHLQLDKDEVGKNRICRMNTYGTKSHLAIVRTPQDNDFILALLERKIGLIWIGLFAGDETEAEAPRDQYNRTWRWLDGSSLKDYNQWYPGEPNDRNHNCTVFRTTLDWCDEPCTHNLYFACSVGAAVTPTSRPWCGWSVSRQYHIGFIPSEYITVYKPYFPHMLPQAALLTCLAMTDPPCLSLTLHTVYEQFLSYNRYDERATLTRDTSWDHFEPYCIGEEDTALLWSEDGVGKAGSTHGGYVWATGYRDDHSPQTAKLGSASGYWCGDWSLQTAFYVYFGRLVSVRFMEIQGAFGVSYHTRSYRLMSSNDTIGWKALQDQNGIWKTFQSNYDNYHLMGTVHVGLVAKYLMIDVTYRSGHPALRLEIYGHDVAEAPGDAFRLRPLGMASREILDSAIWSNYWYGGKEPEEGRLNFTVDDGWRWDRSHNTFLQVDLVILHHVSGVLVQAHRSSMWMVTEMYVSYAEDFFFSYILDQDNNTKTFLASQSFDDDMELGFLVDFERSYLMRYIRLYPRERISLYPYMRIEVLGYPADMPTLVWTEDNMVVTGSSSSCPARNAFIPGADVSCLGWCPQTSSWWLQLQLDLLYYVVRLSVQRSDGDDDLDPMQYYSGRQTAISGDIVWADIQERIFEEPGNVTGYWDYRLAPSVRLRHLLINSTNSQTSNCYRFVLNGKPAQPCPPGSVQIESRCVYVTRVAMEQDEAVTTCADFTWLEDGHLFHVYTFHDIHYGATFRNQWTYLRVDGKNEDGTWKMWNNTEYLQLPWTPVADQGDDCIQIDSDPEFETSRCTINRNALCETPASEASAETDCARVWWVEYNRVMFGNDLLTEVLALETCVTACTQMEGCLSLSYHAASSTCTLHNTSRLVYQLIANSQYDYYEYYCKPTESGHWQELVRNHHGDPSQMNMTTSTAYPGYPNAPLPLDTRCGWFSTSAAAQWIRTDFAEAMLVYALTTQRDSCRSSTGWTSTFILYRHPNHPGWSTYINQTTGNLQVFPCSWTVDFYCSRALPYATLLTSIMFFLPNHYTYWAFQFELYGHPVYDTGPPVLPLGMSTGEISDGQLASSSSVWPAGSTLHRTELSARMNRQGLAAYFYHVWQPIPTDTLPWFEVSLHAVYVLEGILLSGDGTYYVKKFSVMARNGTDTDWQYYSNEQGEPLELPAVVTSPIPDGLGMYQLFQPNLYTRNVLLLPLEKYGYFVLRFELYGYVADGPVLDVIQTVCGDVSLPGGSACTQLCSDGGLTDAFIRISLLQLMFISSIRLHSDVEIDASNFTVTYTIDTDPSVGQWEEFPNDRTQPWPDVPNADSQVVWYVHHRHWPARHVRITVPASPNIGCTNITLHGYTPDDACPPNHALYRDNCYRVYDVLTEGSDAEERCRSDGEAWAGAGHLAVVEDLYLRQFLWNLAPDKRRPYRTSGSWNNSTSEWEWVGADANFTWTLANPDPSIGHVVGLTGTGIFLEAFPADTVMPYICEMDAAVQVSAFDWLSISGHYLTATDDSTTERSSSNVSRCLHACQFEEGLRCSAVSYKEYTRTCRLHTQDRYTPGALLTPNTYWVYHEFYKQDPGEVALLAGGQATNLSTSSLFDDDIKYGKINKTGQGFWRPADSDVNNTFIYVTFIESVALSRILVQGSGGTVNQGKVTSFKMSYRDGEEWIPIKNEQDDSLVFPGPATHLWPIVHVLPSRPQAVAFLIEPERDDQPFAMQLEMFGSFFESPSSCFADADPIIIPFGYASPADIICEGQWTVFMKRNHSDEFDRQWVDYKYGFNDPSAYWGGNQLLYYVTKMASMRLRIEMWTDSEDPYSEGFHYAEFTGVRSDSETEGYPLIISKYKDGNCGGGGLVTNQSHFELFSTPSVGDCERPAGGAWWMDDIMGCALSSLTADTPTWYTPDGLLTDMGLIKIKIREEDASLVNLAKKKEVTMLQENIALPGSLSVDGDMTEDSQCSMATITASGTATWMVDLSKREYIASVGSKGQNLVGTEVLVGNEEVSSDFEDNGFVVCGSITSDANEVISVMCPATDSTQYVVLRRTGNLNLCEVVVYPAEVLREYGESCEWNAQCSYEYAACRPAEGTMFNESLICRCKDYYLRHGDFCIPVADIMLEFLDLTYQEDVGVIRDTGTLVDLNLRVNHQLGATVTRAPTGTVNFNLEFYLSIDQQLNLTDDFSITALIESVIDYRQVFDEKGNFTLGLSMRPDLPADVCHRVHYLCVLLLPGNGSSPFSYIEIDPSNDWTCFAFNKICKPGVDVSVNLQLPVYEPALPIIRAFSGDYVFRLYVNYDAGTYPISPLNTTVISTDFNFAVVYFYSESLITDITLASEYTQYEAVMGESGQAGVAVLGNLDLEVTIQKGMTLVECGSITHLCFLLYNSTLGSYSELDDTDNIICMDITSLKECTPATRISVDSADLPAGMVLVRNYPEVFYYDCTFTNIDDDFDVEDLANDNFNLTIFFSDGSSVPTIGPFVADPITTVAKYLARNDSITVQLQVQVFIPTEECSSLSQLCAEVAPASGASYKMADGGDNIRCHDVSGTTLNCEGIAATDVRITPDPLYLLQGESASISVYWLEGTEISYVLQYTEGIISTWDWQEAGHVNYYGPYTSNVNHTFTNYGNTTLELITTNSMGEATHATILFVEPDLDTVLTLDAINLPAPSPVNVTFKFQPVDVSNTAAFLIWCEIDFNDDANLADPNRSISDWVDDGSVDVTHEYLSDDANVTCTATCQNHVSSTVLQYNVVLRGNVTGLTVTATAIAVATGEVAQFVLSLESGSHVHFNIDPGDGSTPFIETHPDIYSHASPMTVEHTYTAAGNYTITVQAYNEFFEDTASTLTDIVIQNSVETLSIDGDTSVAVPPGDFAMWVRVDPSEPYPTNVFCSFKLTGEYLFTAYLPMLSSGTDYDSIATAVRDHCGDDNELIAYCHNLATNISLTHLISVYEVIDGLSADMDAAALPVDVTGNVTITVGSGSSVEYTIDYGDSTSEVDSHPSLFAVDSPFRAGHSYTSPGNYTVVVSAANPVITQSYTIPYDVVVQNIASHILLAAPISILWPREDVQFTLSAADDQPDLDNLHCVWDYGGIQSEYIYVDTLTTATSNPYVKSLPRAAVGNLTTNINCSNLVSYTSAEADTEVILDATILEELTCNGSVWWQNVSGFILTISRTAQYTCHKWDMGDGDIYLYGGSNCLSDSQAAGWTYIDFDTELTTLMVEHEYETWGEYVVTVFSYNDVSDDTRTTTAIVWEWVCVPPNITFSINETSLEQPYVKMKSENFTISAELSIHCMYTRQTVESWHVRQVTGGAISTIDVESSEEDIYVYITRQLDYGIYAVILMANMLEQEGTESEANVFLEIIPTPIQTSIVNGEFINVPFGTVYVFNAIDVSVDPDVDPGDQSGFTFSWLCLRSNMSDLVWAYYALLGPDFDDTFPDAINSPAYTAAVAAAESGGSDDDEDEDDEDDDEDDDGDSNEDDSDESSEEGSEGPCMVDGELIMGRTEGQFAVNTSWMYPMTYHNITVIAMKDDRQAQFSQVLYVEPAPAPDMDVSCRENCADRCAFSRRLVHDALCLGHCSTVFGGLSYHWRIYQHLDDDSLVEDTNLTDYTVAGIEKKAIFILGNKLKPQTYYTLVVTAYTPGSLPANASRTFLVNQPPYGGDCFTDPLEGYASETLFVINCAGWLEWLAFDTQLYYKYTIRSKGSPNKFPVAYGAIEVTEQLTFPVGSLDYDFALEIITFITDSLGDYVEYEAEVTVNPRPIEASVLLDGIASEIGPDSELAGLLTDNTAESMQQAASFIYAAISEVNAVPSSDVNDQASYIRSEFIKMVTTEFPINSPDDLQQVNELTRVCLIAADQVETEALGMAAAKLFELTELTQSFKDGGLVEEPTLAAMNLVDTCTRVMIAGQHNNQPTDSADSGESDEEDTETDDNGELSTAENNAIVADAMRQTEQAIYGVLDMLAEDQRPGDPAVKMVYDEMTVTTETTDPAEQPTLNGESNQGSFMLDMRSALGDDVQTCINSQWFFTIVDVYVYANENGSETSSGTMHFELFPCETSEDRRRRRRRRSVGDELSLQVPYTASVRPQLQEPETVNLTFERPDALHLHSLNISHIPKPVQIDIFPILNGTNGTTTENASLHLYLGVNLLPTPSSYTWYVPLTANASSQSLVPPELVITDMQEYFTVFIKATNLTNGTLFFGLRLTDCAEDACDSLLGDYPRDLTYELRMMEVAGQLWDPVAEEWIDNAVEMTEPVTATEARFESNLFGSLGVGVFVGPNTIDFSTVFLNLDQKLLENMPVVATVLGIILLYIPFAVWCRKKDKKDKLKFAVLPLLDNPPNALYEFQIHVYTGFAAGAETESNVSIVLIGTLSDTGERFLDDGERKNFNKGDENTFLMKVCHDVGDIYAIRITHDNSGQGKKASWFLSKIIVVDELRGKWYLFMCEDWLAVDEGDGQLVRLLRLASHDLTLNAGDLLRSNANRRLYDDHLWLSILRRKTGSNFTRNQRLGCCLALLYLTMVSNAMWFKDESGTESQAITLGPFTFTVYQLYASVMSSITVVPPILLITYCFNRAGEKPKNKEKEAATDDTQSEIWIYSSPEGDEWPITARDGEREVNSVSAKSPEVNARFRCCHDPWPYWCIYIAWAVVVLAVATGAFFTILYSLQWGGEVSTAWLTTFILCFVENVIIIQPIKVLLVAMLISFLFKKDSDTSRYEKKYGNMKDDWMRTMECNTAHNSWTEVEQVNHEGAKRRREMEDKMARMIREVVSQVAVLLLLSIVLYGNQDKTVYLQNRYLANILHSHTGKVTTHKSILGWVSKSFLPGAFFQEFNNGDTTQEYDRRFIDGGYGYRLGKPLLRQIRVTRDPCGIPAVMRGVVHRCTAAYDLASSTEETTDYNNSWLVRPSESVNASLDESSPYVYRSTAELRGSVFWGHLSMYGGGGYTALLGDSLAEAQARVADLEATGWIDEYTRAVFVQLSVLNGNSNRFSMATVLFELSPLGGVFYWSQINSIMLYRYVGGAGLLAIFSELVCLIVFIVIAVRLARRIFKERRKFFKGMWNLTYLITVILFFTATALYIWRCIITVSTLEEIMNNLDKAVSFETLVAADGYYLMFLGFTAFFVTMQFLYILRYNSTIALLAVTLGESRNDLLNMGLCMFLVFVAFAAAGQSGYGSMLPEYASIGTSIKTLFLASIGQFDYSTHEALGGTFPRLFLMTYLLITLLFFINMIVTLLNEFLAAVKDDDSHQPEDHVVVEYFIESFKSLIGIKKKKGVKDVDAQKNN